jgi:hypothetical protein
MPAGKISYNRAVFGEGDTATVVLSSSGSHGAFAAFADFFLHEYMKNCGRVSIAGEKRGV